MHRPFKWVFDDNIDVESEEDEPQPHGMDADGGDGGVRVEGVARNSRAMPPE